MEPVSHRAGESAARLDRGPYAYGTSVDTTLATFWTGVWLPEDEDVVT